MVFEDVSAAGEGQVGREDDGGVASAAGDELKEWGSLLRVRRE